MCAYKNYIANVSAYNTFYLYYNLFRRSNMEFIITKKESENKTIRFPIELIDDINNVITNKDISFSRFVILACEFALKYMESDESRSNQKVTM